MGSLRKRVKRNQAKITCKRIEKVTALSRHLKCPAMKKATTVKPKTQRKLPSRPKRSRQIASYKRSKRTRLMIVPKRKAKTISKKSRAKTKTKEKWRRVQTKRI